MIANTLSPSPPIAPCACKTTSRNPFSTIPPTPPAPSPSTASPANSRSTKPAASFPALLARFCFFPPPRLCSIPGACGNACTRGRILHTAARQRFQPIPKAVMIRTGNSMPDSKPTRRSLLSAASIVPFAAVRGTAANSAVTVGLIGSGGRGTFDAGLLVQDPNARLVAICDIFDDRIDRAKKSIPIENPQVYKDYKKLLESDVDAVIIATPVFLHPGHFEAAVAAHKNIYIEKPAGLDVAGCKRVIKAADSADRKLNITFGFQQRYGPCYRKAKALADSGGLGPIRMG